MQQTINENFTLIKADTRGHASHGWLDSYHSFSFANYYNPERIHFGALRVLNDDTVAAGMGFGTHPHDNMEIISIPTTPQPCILRFNQTFCKINFSGSMEVHLN